MRTAIITSEKDPASLNIKDSLISMFPFWEIGEKFDSNSIFELKKEENKIKIYTAKEDLIYCENIDRKIDADLFIFASRHESAAKTKSLSVHTPGNWAKAEFGGKERSLCIAPAVFLKDSMIKLNEFAKNANANFEIFQEATHHGPYLEKPSFFIEIGSSEKEWENKEAANIIASTIYKIISEKQNKGYKTAIGIGGLHHTPNFYKIILETNFAFGHVCPKYALKHLDKEMLLQAMKKTEPKAQLIVLDWKGMGEEKQRIVKILKGLMLSYKKTKDLYNTPN